MKPFPILAIFFWFLLPMAGWSNAAMPGVWQGGIGARFVPLFPSDSAALQNISMQREEVLVHLYNGYAVVKGTYWMHNRADTMVSMVVGYPVQGTVAAPIVSHINLGEPQAIRVLVNDQPVEQTKGGEGLSNLLDKSPDYSRFDPEKWILWKTKFAPASVTTITVYFIVNCSDARLRKGYNVKKGHAFAYVLESGTAWLGNIDTGSIYMKLMDGLKTSHVNGLLPSNVWRANNDLLSWQFNQLEPGEKSNVLVWYNVGEDSIRFEKEVLPRAAALYVAIDQFDRSAFAGAANWPAIQKNDLSAGDGLFTSIVGWFIFLFVFPMVVAIGLIIYWMRQKKQQKKRWNYG